MTPIPRAFLAVLSIAAAVLIAAPGTLRTPAGWIPAVWSETATLWIGNIGAWLAAGIALVFLWRRPPAGAPSALAMWLVLGAAAWAMATLRLPAAAGMAERWVTASAAALAMGAMVAFYRFATHFPDRFRFIDLLDDPVDPRKLQTPAEAYVLGHARRRARQLPGPVRHFASRARAWRRERVAGQQDGAIGGRFVRGVRALIARTLDRINDQALGFALLFATAAFLAVMSGVPDAGTLLFVPAGFLCVLGMIGLWFSYGRSESEDRGRLLWIVQGATLLIYLPGLVSWGFLIGLLFHADGLSVVASQGLPVAMATGVVLFLVCLATAIFGHGALDPGLMIGRTAVYGALIALLTVIFTGVETLASTVLTRAVALPAWLGAWLGGFGAAIAFGVLRARAERAAQRLVQRIEAERPGAVAG